MFGELREYLLINRQLALPGLGTLILDRRPASFDVANRQILPPTFQYEFREGAVQPARKFYQWLATDLGASERDVIVKFNDFAFDMRNRLLKGDVLDWTGVGRFKKALGGQIEFTPGNESWAEGEIVTAQKVLRETAEHAVRVGEDQRSSAEMRELLNPEKPVRDLGWVLAMSILIIALIVLGIYFSSHGVGSSATANQQKVQLEKAPVAPRFLP
ncbi:MAG: hypothetical protein ACK4E0_12360 [Chitinophagaceae bacterium]